MDSVLIANECLDSKIRSPKPDVPCNLDIEKAYDHVNWSFLLYMLGRCGFRVKWCEWISRCFSMVRFFVLINGTLIGFFNNSSGLRQGILFSPLLFVIVMEALSILLFATVNRGLLSRFLVGSRSNDEFLVSHLLFADDTLIFCEVNPDHLCNLRCLFLCFEAVSSLIIFIVF
jgi:hypothetical protein